jgi:hypothetical protein
LGNVTGSSVSENFRQDPTDALQAANKMAVAKAWKSATFGSGSDVRYLEVKRNYSAQYGKRTVGTDRMVHAGSRTLMSSPVSYQVSMSHRGQTTGYYCGPASGAMILSSTNNNTSYSGTFSLSQANLARDAYMATDANGATNWATSRFRIGLNKWRQGSETGFYVDLHSPTPTDMSVALTYDTYNNNAPFGADTVENAGGPHYNNHPSNLTIGHWIAAYGYWNSGSNAYFMDPATTVWSGLSDSFGATTSSFTNTYLQNNGITW